MTDDNLTVDPQDLDLKRVDRETVRNGDHVLESAVEVWEEYEQRYDPEENAILLGPTSIEDQWDAYTQYNCSCGQAFHDQTEAHEHLLEVAEETK